MGAYRDARQARLAEAAARAQMAAAQAERERQAQARASFNRLVNPPAPVSFDTGLNLPGAEIPVAAEAGGMSFDTGLRARGPQGAPVAAAVSRYTPEQQNQDLANVFMGGMGQDLAAYQSFMNPGPAEVPEQAADFAQITAGRIQSGNMEPEQALTFGYRGAQQYGYRGSLQDFAGLVQAYGPEQQNRQPTALEIRAQEAGLQPGTPEYQQFMLRGGSGYGPRRPNSVDRLAGVVESYITSQGGGSAAPGQIEAGVPLATPEQLERARLPRDTVAQIRYDARGNPYFDVVTEGLSRDDRRALVQSEISSRRQFRDVSRNIERALSQVGPESAGIAALFNEIPGLPPAQLQARIDTILANLGVTALTEMRESSPTGGAVGNVTEREWALLAALRENLSTGQTPDQLRDALRDFQLGWQEVQAERRAVLNEFYPEEYRRIYGNEPAPPIAVPEEILSISPEAAEAAGNEVTYNGIDYRYREGTWRPFYETY